MYLGYLYHDRWVPPFSLVSGLMSGFNFFSHGSQDLYPVYLQTTKKFSSFDASKATIISNVGAIIGKSQSL